MADKFSDWMVILSSLVNATGTPLAMNTCNSMAYEVTFPTNSTAGTVIIEMSADGGFAGVWKQIASVPWGAALSELGGSYQGPLGFVRARLTLQAGTHVTPFVVKVQGHMNT